MKYTEEYIYNVVGKYDNPATFFFKKDSTAYNKYGQYVTGFVKYTKREREELENKLNNNEKSSGQIRIDYPLLNKDKNYKSMLAREGFQCDDISDLIPSNFNKENKFTITNQRELPEAIKIPVDLSGVNFENIFVHHMMFKLRSGHTLIKEESDELLGILLAQNNGNLPKFLANYFKIDREKIKEEEGILWHFFKVKEKNEGLDDYEKLAFAALKLKYYIKRIELLDKELSNTLTKINLDEIPQQAISYIFNKLIEFKPSRLLQIEVPIYWDFESFLHIYLRHVKETQVDKNFENKSKFQYSIEDIEKLIRHVLEKEKKEIIEHFKNNKDKKFYRAGRMGVYYNGDYYSFDISPEGRLITFYKMG